MQPCMPGERVIELLRVFDQVGITAWLDGGWGVDALLGRQTRIHKDLDLVVHVRDVVRLCEVFSSRGFGIREGVPPHSFVLADGKGLEIDVHAVEFDADGNGNYRMQNGEVWVYPADGFKGIGEIEGVEARCLSASTQILGHAEGYEPIEKDIRDMELLAERFGLALPPQLQRKQPYAESGAAVDHGNR